MILCGYGSDLFPLIEPPLHPSSHSPHSSSDSDDAASGPRAGGGGGTTEENDYTNDGTSASSVSGDEGTIGEGPKVQRGFLVQAGRKEGRKEVQGRRDVGQIKSLLPVAGRKMIDWVLDLVEEAGVYGPSLLPALIPKIDELTI